jgi:hypothetical protein
MAETPTVLGEEKRRTGKHMRLEDGRKPRRDRGVPAPQRRQSPEHYRRINEAMKRSTRTGRIVRLLESTGPLTQAQIAEIRAALEGIAILDLDLNLDTDADTSQVVAGAA